jgi:hypothetical protein
MVTETNNMTAVPKTRWRLVKAIIIHEIILALKKRMLSFAILFSINKRMLSFAILVHVM